MDGSVLASLRLLPPSSPDKLGKPARIPLRLRRRDRTLFILLSSVVRELKKVGPVFDASIMSDECGGDPDGSFTGAFVGVAASDLNGTAAQASFDYFVYRPVQLQSDRYEI